MAWIDFVTTECAQTDPGIKETPNPISNMK